MKCHCVVSHESYFGRLDLFGMQVLIFPLFPSHPACSEFIFWPFSRIGEPLLRKNWETASMLISDTTVESLFVTHASDCSVPCRLWVQVLWGIVLYTDRANNFPQHQLKTNSTVITLTVFSYHAFLLT